MSSSTLKPDEFEKFFNADLEEYEKIAPVWISQVQAIDTTASVPTMIENLRNGLKTSARLERALRVAGIPLPQDIPYLEAKQQVEELSNRLQSVADSNEYDKLSQELEKYSSALITSEEYQQEIKRKDQIWEEKNASTNLEALKRLRRHIPVNVRLLTEESLCNEHKLPKQIARKLKRTNILQLVRTNTEELLKVHPSILDQYKTTGLTLTERRALHAHLRPLGIEWGKRKDPSSQRKLEWFNMLKNKLRELVGDWDRHEAEHGGPASTHKCNMLGNQCPFKANSSVDYSGDFGYPEEDVFESQEPIISASCPPVTLSSGLQRNEVSNSRPLAKELFAKKEEMLVLTPVQRSTSKTNFREGVKKIGCPQVSVDIAPSLKSPGAPPSPKHKSVRFSPKLVHAPPKTIAERHQLHMEAYYLTQPPNRLLEAKKSYQSISKSLDLIDLNLENWILQMIMRGGTEPTVDDKTTLKSEFLGTLSSVESTADELSERAKWTARSVPECEIAEDFVSMARIVLKFVLGQMKELAMKDKSIKKCLRKLNDTLAKLHERNLRALKKHDVTIPSPTRKIRTISEIAQAKLKEKRKGKKKRRKATQETVPASAKESLGLPSPRAALHAETKHGNEPVAEVDWVDSEALGESNQPSSLECIKKNNSSIEERTDSPSTYCVETYQQPLVWQLARQIEKTDRTNRRLETALKNAGIGIPDEAIPYTVAETKMKELSEKMATMGTDQAEYFVLEREMEKYSSALLSSEEYKQELDRREAEWEQRVRSPNRKALEQIRSHMPVNVRNLTEQALVELNSPSGETLPKAIARKFKRSTVLQLLRMNPRDVEYLHFANLESLSLSGLILTERRALYEHLRNVGTSWEKSRSDPAVERKLLWFNQMKMKFKQDLHRWEEHTQSNGPPSDHKCSLIGKQCPVLANETIDYSHDFGFPQGDIYMVMEVAKEQFCDLAKQAREDSSQAVKEGMAYWERQA